jgi:hypothetical protein
MFGFWTTCLIATELLFLDSLLSFDGLHEKEKSKNSPKTNKD